MKRLFLLVLLLLLASCQNARHTVVIVENGQIETLIVSGLVPRLWLEQAGKSLDSADRLLYLGLPIDPEQSLPAAPAYCVQIRRAVALAVMTPEGERVIRTSAFTVGQALTENGMNIYAADRIEPPAETPIVGPMKVTYTPSWSVVVQVAGQNLEIRTAASTVGAALAEAGIPLQGLDEPLPAESEPLPSDGIIRLRRVHEVVLLEQQAIPFKKEFQPADDLPLDQQKVIQAGEAGLSISRTRLRFSDGEEVGRQVEGEAVVRPPKTQVVGYGTKITLQTVQTPAGPVEYWRAVPMFATSYSPCRSSPERCYPNTASGKPVKKGVVAVTYEMYLALRGQRLYIPGYGFATIEDVGGGIPGKLWIDLGYSDSDYVVWGETVMVYFLAPAPASIPFVLQ